jgi:hypothetical protein
MRTIIPLLLLALSACSQSGDVPVANGSFAGGGSRDRLCFGGTAEARTAGLIVFGQGDNNCSLSGKLEKGETGWVLVPKGEDIDGCRIPISFEGEKATIGQPPPSCAYYCGPQSSMAGKSFGLAAQASPALDLAGDPLCT